MPELTAAVSVTAVPEETEVTGDPPEVIAKVVDVADCALPTLTESDVVATRAPEVPVIVAVAEEAEAVLLAVKVRTGLSVLGFVENAPVTPLGRPLTARLTTPVNPFCGVTTITDSCELPGIKLILFGAAASEKLCAFTVSLIVVDALIAPEVPVIVTVATPGVAVFAAVSVSVLPPVVGFGANEAVTPAGNPDAENVTDPANPY